jgi:hypothetical protein
VELKSVAVEDQQWLERAVDHYHGHAGGHSGDRQDSEGKRLEARGKRLGGFPMPRASSPLPGDHYDRNR